MRIGHGVLAELGEHDEKGEGEERASSSSGCSLYYLSSS